MGNRALLTTKDYPDLSIYLHWHGGPESILAFLEASKQLGIRDAEEDSSYFMARLTQIIANTIGGRLSIGLVNISSDVDADDNGVYTLGPNFTILSNSEGMATEVTGLSDNEKLGYDETLKRALSINRPLFAGA